MPGRTRLLKLLYSTVHAFTLKDKNAEWSPIKAGRSAIAGSQQQHEDHQQDGH
jgi:hypothetical protein